MARDSFLVAGGVGLLSARGDAQTIVTGRIHDARIAQRRVLEYFQSNDIRLKFFARSGAVAALLMSIAILVNILFG